MHLRHHIPVAVVLRCMLTQQLFLVCTVAALEMQFFWSVIIEARLVFARKEDVSIERHHSLSNVTTTAWPYSDLHWHRASRQVVHDQTCQQRHLHALNANVTLLHVPMKLSPVFVISGARE